MRPQTHTAMTKKTPALEAMDVESRRRFCREVLENLSDLVEGEAPEDFCRRVDEVLSDCRPFQAFRNTFEATLELTRQLGRDEALPSMDSEAWRHCVERVRQKL